MTKPINKEGFGLVSESFHIKEMNKKDAEIERLKKLVRQDVKEVIICRHNTRELLPHEKGYE